MKVFQQQTTLCKKTENTNNISEHKEICFVIFFSSFHLISYLISFATINFSHFLECFRA